MKILLIYHMPEREERILKIIRNRIRANKPDSDVRVVSFVEGIKEIFLSKVDTVLMYPTRDEISSTYMTYLKYIKKFRLVLLETEGLFDYNDENFLRIRIGTNKQPYTLIDKMYVFGPRPRDIYARIMLEIDKVREDFRIDWCGYPMYDSYARETEEFVELEKKYIGLKKRYDKIITFITGFSSAALTIEEQKNTSAFKTDERGNVKADEIKKAREAIEAQKLYMKSYIEAIKDVATKNPKALVVAKMHPSEIDNSEVFVKYYKSFFDGLENVYLMDWPEIMGPIIDNSEVLIHYGSTCGIEAYLYKTPTLVLTDSENDKKFNSNRYLYPSTESCSVYDLEKINEIINSIQYKADERIEKYIYDYFGTKVNGKNHRLDVLIDDLINDKSIQYITDEQLRDKYDFKFYIDFMRLRHEIGDKKKDEFVKIINEEFKKRINIHYQGGDNMSFEELINKRICIHGSGAWGSLCEGWLRGIGCENVQVVDANSNKWNKESLGGVIIKNPKDVNLKEIDLYVISVADYNSVFNWVIEHLDIDDSIIRRFDKNTNEIKKPYCELSYSQEGEDIYLQNIFQNVTSGTYVDVGAHHPLRFSNTLWAYKKGWTGINIEPNLAVEDLFKKYRAKDINLFVGISDKEGKLDYYCYDEPGLNGFDKETHSDIPVKEVKEVEVRRLDSIFEEQSINHIDFMSIDVEGYEISVLKSIDWNKVNIEYLLVEQLISINEIFYSEEYKYLADLGYELVAKYGRTSIYKHI